MNADLRHRAHYSILAIALTLTACSSMPTPALYPGSETLLPGTAPEMNTAGYWIGRHVAPDAPILDSAGIGEFNRLVREKELVRDLSIWVPPTNRELRKSLADTLGWIAGLKVYERNGRKVGKEFLIPLKNLMAIDGLASDSDGALPEPPCDARYGFTVHKTNLRVLPTAEPLFDAPGDPYIDNLQASSLEAGTPLAILHQSGDGAWLYVTTELASGWIRADSAVAADRDSFLARYCRTDALVVTDAKADLYADASRTAFIGSVRMGTRLVPAALTGDIEVFPAPMATAVAVSIPVRGENGSYAETTAWVSPSSVSEGFLPFTPRTIYEAAFRLLNSPYGWGGTFGEQDCSQFLCEIFDVAGIVLPRNSSKQAKSGCPIPAFHEMTDGAKQAVLAERAFPGATLLRLPGHIMLYLGSVEGRPYIIHATFAYKEKIRGRVRTRLINRVVVSTLELGTGSPRGSHLHRLTDAIAIDLPTPETSQTPIVAAATETPPK